MAATALMGVALVSGASAHSVKYESTVTATFKKAGKDPATFDGTVASATARCAADRAVQLRLKASDGSSSVVATDTTDSLGAWIIQQAADPAPGTYFAQATKKVLKKNSKHRHACKKAISGDIAVK